MKTTEQIKEIIENLPDSEIVSLWNDYQSEINGESQIYDFDDEFFETFFSDPAEAARATYFGKIESWNAKYVQFNGYGNLEASNYLDDMVSYYDLANHIEGKQDEYENILGEDDNDDD